MSAEIFHVAAIDGNALYVTRGEDGIASVSAVMNDLAGTMAQVELLPADAQRLSDLLRVEPLMATVDTIAALDEVLRLARTYSSRLDAEMAASIREVEQLRTALRQGLRAA